MSARLRRIAMGSALNTIARALGRPLDAIPTAPARLRPLLAGVTPAMANVSTGSWRNALSLLSAAVDHVEGGILPRLSTAETFWSAAAE